MDQLIKREAKVLYNDPYIPYIKKTRKYDFGLISTPLSKELLKEVDAVLLITDHSDYNYEWILDIPYLEPHLLVSFKRWGKNYLRHNNVV